MENGSIALSVTQNLGIGAYNILYRKRLLGQGNC